MPQHRIDLSKLRATPFGVHEHTFSERDVILYNLGVGSHATDLKHVFEQHPAFVALPTFTCASALQATALVPLADFLPNFNPAQLLHGEQFLALLGDIPTSGTLCHHPTVQSVADKGHAAAVVSEVRTTDAEGNNLAINQFTTFVRGSGNFEVSDAHPAERPPDATAANKLPERPPDFMLQASTSEDQAAIYRLSGDGNPLHIDPEFAAAAGFERPILHGLCTLGIVTRRLMSHFGIGSSSSHQHRLQTLKVRFAGHVFPGETLHIEAWVVGDGSRIVFKAATKERGKLVLSHAALTINPPFNPAVARL